MKGHGNIYVARVLSSIGYNLSAMGKNELVDNYYNAAINMLYYLKMPEDIAEVYYNKSLNYIMQGNYKEAVHALLVAMKTIIKLHLNSLRVCNTSKVYALLALASIFSGDRFSCERYLLSCKQFLNYVIYRVIDTTRTEVVHDCSCGTMVKRKKPFYVLRMRRDISLMRRETNFLHIRYTGKAG